MTTIPAFGHDWDENMRCGCGRTWREHQGDPRPCPRVLLSKSQQPKRAGRPVSSMSTESLAQLRVALGLPIASVAAAVGVSTWSASKAERGEVGGSGRPSKQIRDRIEAFLAERSEVD